METERIEKHLFGLPLSDWNRLPHGPTWVRKRKPGFIVTRTRVVRLSDGSTERFFVLRERPKNNRELIALEKEIGILKREIARTRIVFTERALLAAKNARNGIRKPRRKKR